MNTPYDPTDLAGQEAVREEADTRKRLEAESEELDVKWLMSSKRGRRIVWRLLEQAGVFRLSFDPNALQMAFNEGNRNFGNRTLSQVHEFCSEQYPVMVKENTHGNDRNDGSGRNK
jgi:hypothetical protein